MRRRLDSAVTLGLAAVSFALAFAQRPGWASSDTKIDLHVAPGRFLSDVASVWTPSGSLGHVQGGQYGGYLFPMGPFYAVGHALGLAPWVVHRLWLGALLALAAWGTVRLLDDLVGRPRGVAHIVAGAMIVPSTLRRRVQRAHERDPARLRRAALAPAGRMTIGRAARNIEGTVLMYADKETAAMRAAIGETDRRRAIQLAYNVEHGITAATIVKGISDIAEFLQAEGKTPKGRRRSDRKRIKTEDLSLTEMEKTIVELEEEMLAAAEDLRFEYAARLRDEIRELRRELADIQRNEAPAA